MVYKYSVIIISWRMFNNLEVMGMFGNVYYELVYVFFFCKKKMFNIIIIEFMFAGIKMFWVRFRFICKCWN